MIEAAAWPRELRFEHHASSGPKYISKRSSAKYIAAGMPPSVRQLLGLDLKC